MYTVPHHGVPHKASDEVQGERERKNSFVEKLEMFLRTRDSLDLEAGNVFGRIASSTISMNRYVYRWFDPVRRPFHICSVSSTRICGQGTCQKATRRNSSTIMNERNMTTALSTTTTPNSATLRPC